MAFAASSHLASPADSHRSRGATRHELIDERQLAKVRVGEGALDARSLRRAGFTPRRQRELFSLRPFRDGRAGEQAASRQTAA